MYPKSLEISRTFEWENLGFSCQICNQNKSDKDPNYEHIIDPYNVSPEPYIRFIGAFINSNGTLLGRMTISHLKLDRIELFERRQETFRNLIKSIDVIQMARNLQEKQTLIEDFETNELGKEKEFAAMRWDFWKTFKPSDSM